MPSYYENLYYHPEKAKLTIVGEIDVAGSYEFDKFVVWQKPDGSLWCAEDSGCSCPSPFEDLTVAALQPYTPETLREWHNRLTRKAPSEVQALILSCKEAARQATLKAKRTKAKRRK